MGEEAQKHYEIVIDDPARAAKIMKQAMPDVRSHRKETGDAYSYNWSLHIEPEFQLPFDPTHESMAALDLHMDQKQRALQRIYVKRSLIVAVTLKPKAFLKSRNT